jgi:hypothetical protein
VSTKVLFTKNIYDVDMRPRRRFLTTLCSRTGDARDLEQVRPDDCPLSFGVGTSPRAGTIDVHSHGVVAAVLSLDEANMDAVSGGNARRLLSLS